MGSVHKILGHLSGGTTKHGAPAALGEREMAFNEEGDVAGDVDSLYIAGAGNTPKKLISNQRQVEITGDQNKIEGRKSISTLAFGGSIGDGSDDVLLPLKGTAADGQILRLNAAGTAMEWSDIVDLTMERVSVPGVGKVEDDMNLLNPSVVINSGEILVVTHNESVYLWMGGEGSVGVGGSLTAIAGNLTFLGSTAFATDAEVKAGTEQSKSVAPDSLKDNYLRTTKNAAIDVPQVLANSLTLQAALTMAANINMAGNTISGVDGSPFTIAFAEMKTLNALNLGAVAGVIQGDNTTSNQIDNCIFDAGTFV